MGIQVFQPSDLLDQPLLKVWSDSAREASIEARRAGKGDSEYFQAPSGAGSTPEQPGFAGMGLGSRGEFQPSMPETHIAIEKEDAKHEAAREREAMTEKIAAKPPVWLPKEKREDWKATVTRNKASSYKQAAIAFKAHEKKIGMSRASERAAKINEARETYAARWKNKL